MTEETFDWRSFLTRWSEEWADAYDAPDELRSAEDEGAWRARWLGFETASAERIAAAEKRLGCQLPPSYRAFLSVTDGWRHAGGFIYRLAGTGQARWHEDGHGLSEYYHDGELDGMWERALQLDVESDMTTVLLDPLDTDEDGEWAVYCHTSWAHCPPTRYSSFQEFMLAQYQEFHRLAANHADREGRAFANDTTRRLDALVETGRLDALSGAYERAAVTLTEAAGFGRPRAHGMLDQLRRLQGETYMLSYDGLARDTLYFRELVPLLALEHVRWRREAADWPRQVEAGSEERREAAQEILREVVEGTFRYDTPGPFGEAVERAREQARWGRTEAAWQILLAGLPLWTPLGPDHLAPVGLLADSVLGPVITPERGRILLATPRAAGPNATAADPGTGPDDVPESENGLAWLTGPPSDNSHPRPYRFVLVEGAAPAELPARLGGERAELSAPMTREELQRSLFQGGASPTYDDCAVVTVGHAGGASWSFAFDPFPASYDAARYVSPAVTASQDGAASPGARALVVWCVPERGLFHLSAAEQGVQRYAFTFDGSEIHRGDGPIPPTLDPAALFVSPAAPGQGGPDGAGEPDRTGERRALEAIAAEFGVGLPRFALTEGRLHTFTTRSWTRPPEPGDTYAFVTFGGALGSAIRPSTVVEPGTPGSTTV
ncbi:SMI1/KNR4 family protein [Kitasatospora sp. NPDC088160]|uniref:SMI1/KNR4 family protein n=1 Tax=Kitasatospora sp. NPDC088160 TaxID=3364072 RepID=UPI0037F76259